MAEPTKPAQAMPAPQSPSQPAQPRAATAGTSVAPAEAKRPKPAEPRRELAPHLEELAKMESPEARALREARNEPPRTTIHEPHPGDPVRDVNRNVSPTLPESLGGVVAYGEGTVEVTPFKTFEWKGKLVGPSAVKEGEEPEPLIVTKQEAAELRANGLILMPGEEAPAINPDQVMMQSNPRIAVVERQDGRVDPPDDKEAGRKAKLGVE